MPQSPRMVHHVPLKTTESEDWFIVHVADMAAPKFMVHDDDTFTQKFVTDGEQLATLRLIEGLVPYLRNYGLCPVNLLPSGSWVVDNETLVGDES